MVSISKKNVVEVFVMRFRTRYVVLVLRFD